jgi:hypothetical protein
MRISRWQMVDDKRQKENKPLSHDCFTGSGLDKALLKIHFLSSLNPSFNNVQEKMDLI